jgi:hypothetical protein
MILAQPSTATRAAGVVLLGATGLCVAGIFTLTAHGNYGYGHDVMALGAFALAVPVALDVLQVVAIAAAFVLAERPRPVRAYAWLVFALANVASILSNLADAQARHLPWQGWIGQAALPLLLSFGVHLAIVAWRWRPTQQSTPLLLRTSARFAAATVDLHKHQPDVRSKTTEPVKVTPGSDSNSSLPAAGNETILPTPQPAAKRGRRASSAKTDVLRKYRAGERNVAMLALAHGVSKRTVELWTQPLRQPQPKGQTR